MFRKDVRDLMGPNLPPMSAPKWPTRPRVVATSSSPTPCRQPWTNAPLLVSQDLGRLGRGPPAPHTKGMTCHTNDSAGWRRGVGLQDRHRGEANFEALQGLLALARHLWGYKPIVGPFVGVSTYRTCSIVPIATCSDTVIQLEVGDVHRWLNECYC